MTFSHACGAHGAATNFAYSFDARAIRASMREISLETPNYLARWREKSPFGDPYSAIYTTFSGLAA